MHPSQNQFGRLDPYQPLPSYLRFFCAALLNPLQTGGIIPSQRFLIGKMIAPVPENYSGCIVELGPGNGALTLKLAARCAQARILACEINPVLAQDCRATLIAAGFGARVEVVSEPAERLLSRVALRGYPKVGYVISGIPLGNLRRDRSLALIRAVSRTLVEGGMYIQFQHSLMERKGIKATFSDVKVRPVVLNFPPAVVYYARR
jgi:phospholipid N-methyltransferase